MDRDRPFYAALAAGAAGAALALAVAPWQGAALAQTRPETVTWTVAPQSADPVAPGAKVAVTLRGAVLDGWHVYGLKQASGGPTPLVVSLDKSEIAVAAGAPVGSPPVKLHDAAFNLETQFYAQAFTVTAPVKIAARAPAGRQLIPVNVRFQTCNGTICQPPKTVRLSVPINVLRADG